VVDTREQIQQLLSDAPEEVRSALIRIIRAEKEKLHLKQPRGVPDTLAAEIKDTVK
jgi:hypothetical protein